jgi:diacylglycerol kinase (ATP)
MKKLATSRNAIVVHSPHSGRSALLSEALIYAQQAGIHIAQVISIAKLDGLPAQGSSWRSMGIDIAIAAGGDGLVGGVISHIVESGLPLGILPLGTANDIARSLHLPLDLSQAAQVIASCKTQEIDVGIAKPAEQAPHVANPEPGGPVLSHVSVRKHGYFAHALIIGLNVQFARLATNVVTRQRYGRFTYPLAALEVLRNHQSLDVELHFKGLALPQTNNSQQSQGAAEQATDNEQMTLRCRALQVAVINAPIFGGAWQLSIPGAKVNDRLLDIVVIEESATQGLSTKLAQFFDQQKLPFTSPTNGEVPSIVHNPADVSHIPGIHHLQARSITITTGSDPQDVTLDGEVRGQTPAHIYLANERLRVIVP